MQCNKCGYVLDAFDGNCPKCGLKRGQGWVAPDFGKTHPEPQKSAPPQDGVQHLLGPNASMFAATPQDEIIVIATKEMRKEKGASNLKEVQRRNKRKRQKAGVLFIAGMFIDSTWGSLDDAELSKRCQSKRLMCSGSCPCCKAVITIIPRRESCTVECPGCSGMLKFKDYIVTAK